MQSDRHMRLSPFHSQLAKCIAQGMENKEILSQYALSDSRLSVIKSNPLFKREIEKFKKLEKDAYNKALEVLENHATEVATTLVDIIKNPATNADTRVKASENVLNRLAQKAGVGQAGTGQELVFEQLLRVTKRTNGLPESDEADIPYDGEAAYNDLMDDLKNAKPLEDVDDIIPPLATTLTQTPALNTDVGMPSVGDNGDGKKWTISPRLMEILERNKTH